MWYNSSIALRENGTAEHSAAPNHFSRERTVMATSDITTTQIPLTKGYVAIVDECDADLAQLSWYSLVSNDGSGRAYARQVKKIKAKPKDKTLTIFLHRVILERKLGRALLKTEYVDHANRNTLDNRRCNLRLATNSQNSHNSQKSVSKTSKYRGVSWSKKREKWLAQISYIGKKLALGGYETEEEAYEAYRKAETELFGEFALANNE